MCGIVGYQPMVVSPESLSERTWAFRRLFKESCIRGLHAYGLARPDGDGVYVLRSYDATEIPYAFAPSMPNIAHARYCQSGDWKVMENNQPITVGSTALAFNGCIHMGTKQEFEAAFDVKCVTDNDGEVLLRKAEGAQNAEEFLETVSEFVGSIRGSFAGVSLAYGRLIVSHNPRRPLYHAFAYGAEWFASTEDIFRRAGFENPQPVPVGTWMI